MHSCKGSMDMKGQLKWIFHWAEGGHPNPHAVQELTL